MVLNATSQKQIVEPAVAIQREYYRATASQYEQMREAEAEASELALTVMTSMIGYLGAQSVLDVGAGTGSGLLLIKKTHPEVQVIGIEPSIHLRQQGYAKGLSPKELIDGDGSCLAFSDASFDLVCEFGALHHIPDPHRVVREMLRVARKAIFICDSNNFGQGSATMRFAKHILNFCKLWPLCDFIKTRGKGYTLSKGDGLAYSYSIFNEFADISSCCRRVHMLNTDRSGPNRYWSAPGVALLGIK